MTESVFKRTIDTMKGFFDKAPQKETLLTHNMNQVTHPDPKIRKESLMRAFEAAAANVGALAAMSHIPHLTPLMAAAHNGDADRLRALIEKGAEISRKHRDKAAKKEKLYSEINAFTEGLPADIVIKTPRIKFKPPAGAK